MITGKTINQLDSTTPSINDTTISSESGTPTVSKRTTWQSIRDLFKSNFDTVYEVLSNKSTSVTTDQASNTKYPSVKSVYDWVTGAFAKYSGDADFYQYSIVRTVDGSGNMTVALKNYEGNDPTPTKPVKIMIGGVVRTITSALSTTRNAGTNWYNAGSSELATREIDFFVYLRWNTNGAGYFELLPSRVGFYHTLSDASGSGTYTNEKYLSDTNGGASTDPVVNIGRFNAILSAGAGYTWSIPATSVIINRPIYETRELSYQSTATCDGGATLNGISYYSTYIIKGNTLIKKIRVNWTSITGGTAYAIILKKPFQDNYGTWAYKNIGDIYDAGGHFIGQSFNDGSGNEYIAKNSGAALLSTSGSIIINNIETI